MVDIRILEVDKGIPTLYWSHHLRLLCLEIEDILEVVELSMLHETCAKLADVALEPVVRLTFVEQFQILCLVLVESVFH